MALSPRDMLFMARTHCGGLGISIIRDGQLIAAVGAASAVRLGELVHVRIPSDTITSGSEPYSSSAKLCRIRIAVSC